MILIFNLKRKRLFRVFFDSDIYGGSERIKISLREIFPFLLAQKNKSKLLFFTRFVIRSNLRFSSSRKLK